MLEIWNHGAEVEAFVRQREWSHESHDGRLYRLPAARQRTGGRILGERFPHQEHLLRQATLEDVFLRRAGRALGGPVMRRTLSNVSRLAWTVWRRDFDVYLTTWKTNFLPPLLEPVFYVLAFGLGLGSLIGDARRTTGAR